MRYLILMMIFFTHIFASEFKKVLFISSYDLSFPTVSKQIKGIREVLDEKNYQLDIEFMDTKRLNPQDVEFTFFQVLNIKKELLKDYDAILVGDDNALHFVKNYQNAFFFEKPIIFLSVNNVPFANEVAKNKYITGVIEEQSIHETISLINRLHPNEPKVTVLIDDTTTAKGVVNSFDKKTLEKVDFFNISKYSFSELEHKLKSIPKSKPLLYISTLLDKNSEIKEFYRSLTFVKKYTVSPIYHLYEHGIGEGLIGGKVVIFAEQGRKAATIVKEVLLGKSIENIKPLNTENKYLFDYNELVKFDILDKVPKDSIFINKPKTFFEQPLVDVLLQIIALFTLIFLWVVFLLFRLRKSSKKLARSYNDVQGIINSTAEGIILTRNNLCINANTSALKLLKYKKEDLIKKNISELFTVENNEANSYEAKILDSEGKLIPFFVYEKDIRLREKQVKIYSIVDLRDIKQKEKAIQENLKMAAVGRMMINISHQWRQPLNVITSTASSWKTYDELDVLDKDEMIKDAELIQKHAEELSQTIDNFMHFFKDKDTIESFEMQELINNILYLEDGSIKMNDVKISLNIYSKTKINYKKSEVLQVLANVINNSIEALTKNIEKDRLLLISIKEENENIVIDILDNAGGVTEEVLSKIFEPYISTKDQLNGYGLGLYMAYSILNKIKGTILIENKSFKINNIEYRGLDTTITIPIKTSS